MSKTLWEMLMLTDKRLLLHAYYVDGLYEPSVGLGFRN